ncbi:epsin-1 [[Candida] jaroonii]|uniref:Epsin-1 n=1 Tax=[Candida] jaroonii TaxID=467808 RepID=A0ACA9Y3R9_9ASCO|nr:epsin-1 [[Candida] jaroonii]
MGIVRSIKNVANGYSSVQILVRNATSNDATGPTTYDMEQISSYTYQSQTEFLEIMDMLDRRLNDKGKNWRHVAKSLTVLDYLVRFGSEKCVMWSKDNIYIIKTLREFVHFDESDNDQGAIIRVKAKELVSLLRDDDRLHHERQLAKNHERPARNVTNSSSSRRREDPYDSELEKALELSRITAQQENQNRQVDNDDDLNAALKLSLEEEQMRKSKLQNDNLLDLDDQPQYYFQPQYYVPQQQQQQQQQYDMFGNPIQNPMMTGYQQQYQMQPQYTQYVQPQQPQFTGFNYQPTSQPQPELTPLKTGSNNPFAMSSQSQPTQPTQPSLNDMQAQNNFFTQPPPQAQEKPLVSQNTSSSKYGDHSHPELNNLLAQGTGIDTFGNTGDTRVAHHYTKSHSMLTSNYTGIQNTDKSLQPTSTGNPFVQQPQQPQQQQPVYTGYGFGNNQKDGPSLIDI